MQSAASDRIIYEHPLNEKTRTFLRLEHLFLQIQYHLPKDEIWASRAAIDSLIDMVSIFSRADIKADLIKELDRHRGKLGAIRQTSDVDIERLTQILADLEQTIQQLYSLTGQLGQELRNNEFLKSIMQRSSIPGGNCAFDLPQYHYWLQQSSGFRHKELQEWSDSLEPIRSAIMLLLSLIRRSTHPTHETARGGFFQRTLDSQAPVQLIRVGLPRELPLYAEVSGGKHRFSIRFMEPIETDRPAQTREDIKFLLHCCIL